MTRETVCYISSNSEWNMVDTLISFVAKGICFLGMIYVCLQSAHVLNVRIKSKTCQSVVFNSNSSFNHTSLWLESKWIKISHWYICITRKYGLSLKRVVSFLYSRLCFDALDSGGCGHNFELEIFKLIWRIIKLHNTYQIALKWMPNLLLISQQWFRYCLVTLNNKLLHVGLSIFFDSWWKSPKKQVPSMITKATL